MITHEIFSDVVHSASNNMLPYRTQPTVVCVAQVKSTVKSSISSLNLLLFRLENHQYCSNKRELYVIKSCLSENCSSSMIELVFIPIFYCFVFFSVRSTFFFLIFNDNSYLFRLLLIFAWFICQIIDISNKLNC